MKTFYTLVSFLCLYASAGAQLVNISGQCITGTIPLTYVGEVDGKPAYEGTGTVDGIAGIPVSILWLTPDNIWVIAFDGQPYFQSTCNTDEPPGTAHPSCSWTTVSGTTCTGGSPLTITGSVALPVKLVSFSATKAGSQVLLNWKTATEINNKGFEIQRSSDGSNWTAIGFVQGAGNSQSELDYRFTDAAPLSGKNFYRLLQLDGDGRKEYSNVVPVDFFRAAYYSIGNNPGSGLFTLTIQSASPVEGTLLDLGGKKILGSLYAPGVHALDLSAYPAGVYILRLQRGNEIVTEKLIKQ